MRSILAYIGHNEGKVGLSRAYFLIVPPTQQLKSSWQNQNLCSSIDAPLAITNHQHSTEQEYHNLWCAPKSLVSPKLGLSHLGCGISGTQGTLPTSSTKGGEKGVLKASGLDKEEGQAYSFIWSCIQIWRAPKSRGETPLRVSQSQVAESWDLVACSRLPTLKRGRGSSWEPRD
jgi:hypothetical protein